MLTSDEVQIWHVDLTRPEADCRTLRELLDFEELARADRFQFDRDRRRFIVARGALRQILGNQMGIAPAQVRFSYSAYGKPSLAAELDSELTFNVSHSHELALIAITRGRALGIDVEHMREVHDAEQIVKRFFSIAEQQAFFAVPADQRVAAFFRCWTRKEAFVKAIGEGISRSLETFDVTLDSGPPVLLRDAADPAAPLRWQWDHLEPAAGYVGACVVEGRDLALCSLVWVADG